MLRTLVFGIIAGIAGKKLYDSGAIDRFNADLKARFGDAKETFDAKLAEKRSARAENEPRSTAAPRRSPEQSPVTPSTVNNIG